MALSLVRSNNPQTSQENIYFSLSRACGPAAGSPLAAQCRMGMLQEFVSFGFYYHYYLIFIGGKIKKPSGTFRALLDAADTRGGFRVGGGEKKSCRFHPLQAGGKKPPSPWGKKKIK